MGKIGKPQKSKKHKKMKQTFDQSRSAEGDFSIGSGRNKMQNLPVKEEDLDRQDMPRTLKDMIRSKSNLNTGIEKKKSNLNTGIEKKKLKHNKKKKLKKAAESMMNEGATKEVRPIPKFIQGKNEKDRNFIRRVETEAHKVVMQSKMEKKYNIKFNSTGSNATLNNDFKKKSSKNKREKDKERKKKKVEAKKEKKRDRKGDFSSFKDEVAFGEVAMAPPSLTAKPRKAADDDDDTARPGKRSLLLKEMMTSTQNTSSQNGESSNQSDSVMKSHPKSKAQRLAGQTLKRKYLSPVQKQITDFQRQKAIDLYRKMKDSKLKAMS